MKMALSLFLSPNLVYKLAPKVNTIPAKRYGHNIEKLLIKVKEISNIDLELPDNVEKFIEYLNQYGENRYFEGRSLLEEYALDNLDETVWSLYMTKTNLSIKQL